MLFRFKLIFLRGYNTLYADPPQFNPIFHRVYYDLFMQTHLSLTLFFTACTVTSLYADPPQFAASTVVNYTLVEGDDFQVVLKAVGNPDTITYKWHDQWQFVSEYFIQLYSVILAYIFDLIYTLCEM